MGGTTLARGQSFNSIIALILGVCSVLGFTSVLSSAAALLAGLLGSVVGLLLVAAATLVDRQLIHRRGARLWSVAALALAFGAGLTLMTQTILEPAAEGHSGFGTIATSLLHVSPRAAATPANLWLVSISAAIVASVVAIDRSVGRGNGVWSLAGCAAVFVGGSTFGASSFGSIPSAASIWFVAVMLATVVWRSISGRLTLGPIAVYSFILILLVLVASEFVPSNFDGRGRFAARQLLQTTDNVPDIDPLVDAVRQQARPSARELFTVTSQYGDEGLSDSPAPPPLRLAVLDTYSMTGWTESGVYASINEDEPLLTRVDPASSNVRRFEIQVKNYGLNRLPTMAGTLQISDAVADKVVGQRGPQRMEMNLETLSLRRIGAIVSYSLAVIEGPESRDSDAYRTRDVRSADSSTSLAQTLDRISKDTSIDRSRLKVWERIIEEIEKSEVAVEAKAGMISSWVRGKTLLDGRKLVVGDPKSAPPGNGPEILTKFVEGDLPTAGIEQRAAAGALLANLSGMQSRVVTGFRLSSGSVDGKTWSYASSDMTAWFEVYVPGVGWETFTADNRSAETTERADPPSSTDASGTTTTPSSVAPPTPPTTTPDTVAHPSASTDSLVALSAAFGLAVVSLLLGPAVLRAYYMGRRRRAFPPASAVAADWVGMVARLDRWGWYGVSRLTPGQVVESLTPKAQEEAGIVKGLLADQMRRNDRIRRPNAGYFPGLAMDALEVDVAGIEGIAELSENARANPALARAASRASYAFAAGVDPEGDALDAQEQASDTAAVLSQAKAVVSIWRRCVACFLVRRSELGDIPQFAEREPPP